MKNVWAPSPQVPKVRGPVAPKSTVDSSHRWAYNFIEGPTSSCRLQKRTWARNLVTHVSLCGAPSPYGLTDFLVPTSVGPKPDWVPKLI